MLDIGKKCWARSMKKWLLQNQPQEVASFLPPVQPPLETTPQFGVTRVFQAGTTQPLLGMVFGTTHIHPTRLARVRGWAENQVLWCNAHNVRVGAQTTKLTTLQLVQLIGAKSTIGGLINQEAKAPPPPSFPHTMLNVEKVKDNMQLAFIENLFTNHEIETNVQTKYLRYRTKTKATCVTSNVFSCRKLWPSFGVAACNMRQCQVCGKACHTLKGFVKTVTWGRQRMKSTCSLFVQIHRKLGNAFVRPCPSPTQALLLSSCRLRTWSPWPSLWHVANTKGQYVLHDLPFVQWTFWSQTDVKL